MIRETLNALLACVVTFVLCAVAYPAAVYGLGHTLFPGQARGSLIERDGKVVGSALIAQPFASEKYFAPRPSAAGATGYAADAASGSNLGTTNPALRDRIALDAARQVASKTGDAALKASLDRLDTLQADVKVKKEVKEPSPAESDAITKLEADAASVLTRALDRSGELGKAADVQVPVDLVTTSGAGLDPDISPEAARYQAARVASARKVPVDRILKLIEDRTDHSAAILGAPPRVNVLRLNLALDEDIPTSASASAATPPTDQAGPTPPEVATPGSPVDETRPVESTRAAAPASVEALTGRVGRIQEAIDTLPIAALSAEVAALKARSTKEFEGVDATAKRLGELVGRVSEMEQNLRSAQARTADARKAGADEAVASIEPRLQALGSKADDAGGAVASLEGQLKALRTQVEALRESSKKDAADEKAARPGRLDLAPAVTLFRGKQYAAAAGAFRALAEARPDDARPWYFAALANGLATGDWRGESEALVAKGVERERAKSPSPFEIDSAFAGLTQETGKDWLTYYRKQAGR